MTTGDDYISRLIQIESGGNPNAITGSNWGLGQFGPGERAKYGLNASNWRDRDAQIRAIQAEAADIDAAHQKQFGTAPTDGQRYLYHQQGMAGAPALLSNPDKPAWEAIRQYYPSDAIAKQAITGNIPRTSPLYGKDPNDISAGDFANLWTSRFDGSQPSAPVQPAQPPQTNVAVNGAINSTGSVPLNPGDSSIATAAPVGNDWASATTTTTPPTMQDALKSVGSALADNSSGGSDQFLAQQMNAARAAQMQLASSMNSQSNAPQPVNMSSLLAAIQRRQQTGSLI